MTTPKKNHTDTKSVTTEHTAVSQLPAPPTAGVPSTPAGWVAGEGPEAGGLRPNAAQTSVAAQAAVEVERSTTFAEDFSSKGPKQAELATCLDRAAAWRAERIRTERWLEYVASEDEAAWNTTLQRIGSFQGAFDYAVTCDGELTTKYPALTQVIRARSVIAQKAGAKRAKANRKKGKGASPVAEAPVSPSAPPVPAAVSGATTNEEVAMK